MHPVMIQISDGSYGRNYGFLVTTLCDRVGWIDCINWEKFRELGSGVTVKVVGHIDMEKKVPSFRECYFTVRERGYL